MGNDPVGARPVSQLGQFGITVNVISSGPIQTGYITPQPEAVVLPDIPLGRLGELGDVAEAILFLASEQAHWVTGRVLFRGDGHEMR